MAAAIVFGIASVTLATIGSPAVRSAYENAVSVRKAREDLDNLKTSIETIQALLLDAEKRQDPSNAIKNLIKRVRDVLYDADDLFDEVATDDMLRKQIRENKLRKKVPSLTSSSLNPFTSSRNSVVAKKVKDIRKSLDEIHRDMKAFGFVECLPERGNYGGERLSDPGRVYIGTENVIGRVKDKDSILEMLLEEANNDVKQDVSILAIVGIGGMGKTTLAHLVYNDDKVQERFKNRWFVCISHTTDDDVFVRKIYQSVCKDGRRDLSTEDQQDEIKVVLKKEGFLLVLDDVWDDHRDQWQRRKGLFSNSAKGSKIIVTTRSDLVAKAVGASKTNTHQLDGLSEKESWGLFESIVGFTPEQKRNPEWGIIGREIVKKCANVPLAIRSIASLLFEKNTIEEWKSFEELLKLGHNHKDGIMPVLKLSYNNLAPNLKPCFAYCSLFPKGHLFDIDGLVDLWASQGYIKTTRDSQNIKDMGKSYFIDLFRRSFFQVHVGYVGVWKMHDLIHDLAKEVVREESIMLTTSSSEITCAGVRHVSVGYAIDDSWSDAHPLLKVNKLRSFLCHSHGSLTLEKQFANLKCLRALQLPNMGIEVVPSSIGELKHLRYLDISSNKIRMLPDDITKLVNLCTLDITFCRELEALPSQFRKLINLRSLKNCLCDKLKHMPPGFEELSSLQHLNEFRVSREIDGAQRSKLDVLSGLKLTVRLRICFVDETDDWDRVEYWQPPLTLQILRIYDYQGPRIPHWGNESTCNQALTTLSLSRCISIKCLPPFRHLPSLKLIKLDGLQELEIIQGEEEEGKERYIPPELKELYLWRLPKLKGRWNVAAASVSTWPPLPSLHTLQIRTCPQLSDMLLCPNLHKLTLDGDSKVEVIQKLLGVHDNYFPPNSIQPSSLQFITLWGNHDLVSFPGEFLTSLRLLNIFGCSKLNEVQLAPLGSNILEGLFLKECPKLELWEENKRGVDWDSLTELTTLRLDEIPSSEKLPDCLRKRQESGLLKFQNSRFTLDEESEPKKISSSSSFSPDFIIRQESCVVM